MTIQMWILTVSHDHVQGHEQHQEGTPAGHVVSIPPILPTHAPHPQDHTQDRVQENRNDPQRRQSADKPARREGE